MSDIVQRLRSMACRPEVSVKDTDMLGDAARHIEAIEKAAMELRDRMDDIACRYKGSIISALIMNQIADFDADFDAATETKE